MTHHNTKLQLGGHKNIYKNIYADTTSKFASIRLLARWSGSVYKLMIHHWLLWFFVYVMIRYIVTRGTSILGEVRNVEIPGATQQLLCSKSHDFLAIFALVHSKINQIA